MDAPSNDRNDGRNDDRPQSSTKTKAALTTAISQRRRLSVTGVAALGPIDTPVVIPVVTITPHKGSQSPFQFINNLPLSVDS
ncbi:MAG: hypothetical protein AAFP03_14610, partial [Cyanobacteria bacterium J06598_3]